MLKNALFGCLPYVRRENASASLVTMVTTVVVAVTTVTTATVAKAAVTVAKEKRVTLSLERVILTVLRAGLGRSVIEVLNNNNC